jgi:hypothetical protein
LKEHERNAFAEYCFGADRRWGGLVPDQQIYSHGVEHQNDFEHRRRGCRLRLAPAGGRIMGEREEFPAYAMTGLLLHEILHTWASSRSPDDIWSLGTPYAWISGLNPSSAIGPKDA